MNCEICGLEFVDDSFVHTNYLTHKIIIHGEGVND